MKTFAFTQTTNDIRVTVIPVYLDEHSEPESSHYIWAYNVRIENMSGRSVQLMQRHWKITNGLGRTEEVNGPGVVGEQPVIQPGSMYEYTSGCPLTTPSGFMTGSYHMVSEGGEHMEVTIPTFSLDTPEKAAVKH